MAEFVIQSGKFRGKRLRIAEPEIIVGRDESCRIRITSPDVSRYHCLIRKGDAGWTVRDLGSSNGTFVNEGLIEAERELDVGDVVRVGPMMLEFGGTGDPDERKSAKKRRNTSEDEIADWLSEGMQEPASRRIGDTTIITGDRSDASSTADTDHSIPAVKAQRPEREPAKQLTVAEEAAIIIRRHWDATKNEQQQADAPPPSAE